MDVDEPTSKKPYLQPNREEVLTVPLDHAERAGLRILLGEELMGEGNAGDRQPDPNAFFDYETPTVDAGDIFKGESPLPEDDPKKKRVWWVVDTHFGRKYLVLADKRGAFILLALRPDESDVLVVFNRPVPTDHESRHDTIEYDESVYERNREQYVKFSWICQKTLALHARLKRPKS